MFSFGFILGSGGWMSFLWFFPLGFFFFFGFSWLFFALFLFSFVVVVVVVSRCVCGGVTVLEILADRLVSVAKIFFRENSGFIRLIIVLFLIGHAFCANGLGVNGSLIKRLKRKYLFAGNTIYTYILLLLLVLLLLLLLFVCYVSLSITDFCNFLT